MNDKSAEKETPEEKFKRLKSIFDRVSASSAEKIAVVLEKKQITISKENLKSFNKSHLTYDNNATSTKISINSIKDFKVI